jgi:tetratricopeptide (TPR) repeat protein
MSIILNTYSTVVKTKLLPSVGQAGSPTDIAEVREKVEKLKSEEKDLDAVYMDAVRLLEVEIARCSKLDFKRRSALYAELAKTHNFFGNCEAALKASNKALSNNHGNLEAKLEKGRALFFLQRFDEAVSVFESITKKLPSNPNSLSPSEKKLLKNAYLGMAQAYDNLGARNRSKKFYNLSIESSRKALEIDPDFQLANLAMATANLGLHVIDPFGRIGDSSFASPDIYLERAILCYASVNQEKLMEERAEGDHRALKMYRLGADLKEELGVNLYNFVEVKKAVLKYHPDQVPLMINAYRMNFIRYIPDAVSDSTPNNPNFFKTPQKYLADRAGDCDDFIPFASEILAGANIPYETIVFGVREDKPRKSSGPENPEEFLRIDPSHVTILYKKEGEYIFLELVGIADIRGKTITEALKKLFVGVSDNKYEIIEVDYKNHTYKIKKEKKY